MKKIAILADFPLQFLKSFASGLDQRNHYATWLPQLSESFADQKDFQISWVILTRMLQEERVLSQWNQTFHVIPTMKSNRFRGIYRKDRAALKKILQKLNPDLVHGWGSEDLYGWAAVTSGRPNIYSCQGLLSHYVLKARMHPKNYFHALMELYVLNKAQVITTESAWAKEKIKHRTWGKDIRVIEYGVSPQFLVETNTPNRTNPYALFVGHADYRKGIDFAVRIFSRPELSKYSLKVCGKVPTATEKYLKGGPKNIDWLGRQTEAETRLLMKNATFLLLPTRADTGPTVAKEARAMGLPVVASPHGGHTAFIISGETGVILPLNKVELWVDACLSFLQDEQLGIRMGRANLASDKNKLSPSKTASSFLELYLEILFGTKK